MSVIINNYNCLLQESGYSDPSSNIFLTKHILQPTNQTVQLYYLSVGISATVSLAAKIPPLKSS